MTYDELLAVCDGLGLTVKEKDLLAYDGRIKGSRIAIRRGIPSQKGKACVLAEELGHWCTTTGDILDGSDIASRKQERRARLWAYDLQIGMPGIIRAWEEGCRNVYEAAEYLDVTEGFLRDCISCYTSIYGTEPVRCQGYLIQFEPHLDIRPDTSRVEDR